MGVQVRVRLRAERGREGWVVTHSQQDGHKGALVLQESYAGNKREGLLLLLLIIIRRQLKSQH